MLRPVIIVLMKAMRIPPRRWLTLALLALLMLVFLFGLWQVTAQSNLGGEDFVTYWAATSLVRDGLNPYDPALMRAVQESLVPLGAEYTPMAWNPPPLFVFLLPLTLLPYDPARFVWLLWNLAIVAGCSLLLARLYFPAGARRWTGLFLLFAFSLPQVVVGIFMGQVTFLVFLGLTAALVLIRKEKWFWAGAVLVLTSIKPHMVVLVLVYLLLIMMMSSRRRAGWLGLGLAGLACGVLLFLLRPEWVRDLLGEMSIAPVHWATPTIGGLLSHYGAGEAARYIIVLLLPLPVLLARRQKALSVEFSAALLTLLTVPCTFFGWSFDQVILLVPAAQVFAWLAGVERRGVRVGFALAIAGGVVVNWVLRFLNINDLFTLWYPLYWWLLFGLAWRFSRPAGRPA